MSKKILFILMPKDYRDEEFYEPYNILKEKGFEIDVASFQGGIAVGSNGYEFTPNLVIDQLNNSKEHTQPAPKAMAGTASVETFNVEDFNKYDALVIPGGPGSTKYLWNNKTVQSIIKLFHNNKKVVAAICYAVIAVVQSGILKDKNATVYPTKEAKEILQEHNVNFVHDGTVSLEAEKIITSQGPAFAKDFGEQISMLLQN